MYTASLWRPFYHVLPLWLPFHHVLPLSGCHFTMCWLFACYSTMCCRSGWHFSTGYCFQLFCSCSPFITVSSSSTSVPSCPWCCSVIICHANPVCLAITRIAEQKIKIYLGKLGSLRAWKIKNVQAINWGVERRIAVEGDIVRENKWARDQESIRTYEIEKTGSYHDNRKESRNNSNFERSSTTPSSIPHLRWMRIVNLRTPEPWVPRYFVKLRPPKRGWYNPLKYHKPACFRRQWIQWR